MKDKQEHRQCGKEEEKLEEVGKRLREGRRGRTGTRNRG